jgi:chromate reductase, NAD(P)H dehydrogenase (quinone)
MPRILAISGSLRAGSYSTALLRDAARRAGDELELVLFDGLRDLPAFDEDIAEDGERDEAVRHLKQEFADADAVLISTPEYNGSVPGALKNALDWVSRPFETNPLRGKPVAIVSSSTGSFGGVWAQNDLRRILGTIGARVVDATATVPQAHTRIDEAGELSHPETSEQLDEVLAALDAELASLPVSRV